MAAAYTGSYTDPRCSKTAIRDFTTNITQVKVSKGGVAFAVHEKLLREHSDFFDAALKKDWKEGQEREVQLPDEDSETFSRFVEWLYSGRVAVGTSLVSLNFDQEVEALSSLYVLGERLLATEFQNALIDAFVRLGRNCNKWPSLKAIEIIYNGTSSGSLARRLMVDSWVRFATGDWRKADDGSVKDAHPEFLTDLVQALLERRALPTSKGFEELLCGVPKGYHKSRDDASECISMDGRISMDDLRKRQANGLMNRALYCARKKADVFHFNPAR